MAMHHIHKRRKRKDIVNEGKFVKFLDRFLIIVGVISPMMTLPQIFKIYSAQNAAGVSIISWTFYAIFDIPWIVYGFVHKEKPIIISYLAWLLMNLAVVVGCLIY